MAFGYHKPEYEKIFRDAIGTGQTDRLSHLITEKKFKIHNDPSLLVCAVAKCSLTVATLLLDHGMDPNAWNGAPFEAGLITRENYNFIRTVDDHGLHAFAGKKIDRRGYLLSMAVTTQQLDMVRLLLERGVTLTIFTMRKAMDLANPAARPDVYPENIPIEILKALLDHASRLVNDPNVDEISRNFGKFSRLCAAVIRDDVAEVTRLLEVGDYESCESVLQYGSQIFLQEAFGRCTYICKVFTELLEHGANSKFTFYPSKTKHDPIYYIHHFVTNNCCVVRHLQKLLLIDSDYVERIVSKVLNLDIQIFIEIENSIQLELEEEIEVMKNVQISQGTTYAPSQTLYDFIFFDRNKATRYSRNEIVLNIHRELGNDFRNFLPHYGFALNHQLRKGTARLDQYEEIFEFFHSALGSGLLEDFPDLVFGFFSNSYLKKIIISEPTAESNDSSRRLEAEPEAKPEALLYPSRSKKVIKVSKRSFKMILFFAVEAFLSLLLFFIILYYQYYIIHE